MTESVDSDRKLLQIKNLKTYFYTEEGVVKAVDGTSFDIYEDEVIGLVGETGCGKSVTALSILNLVRAPGKILEGQILFKGQNSRSTQFSQSCYDSWGSSRGNFFIASK
ncbi:MAG: ATP-binding cassette domain-containing protein [Promethearchaeota archaeon]